MMKMEPYFQVNAVSEDISLALQNAFLPMGKVLNGFTPGFVEMDFFLCEDGSLCLDRITSSNADLYFYFRKRITHLRIDNASVERRRSYNLRFSVS